MKGHPQVVQDLGEYLAFELTGHRQYLLHGSMCRHWGFARLGQVQLAYSEEEIRHATRIAGRILLLGETPSMHGVRDVTLRGAAPEPSGQAVARQPEGAVAGRLAGGVAAQLGDDRDLVSAAIAHLTRAIGRCEQHGDFVSRDLLVEMLDDEELHLDWLDQQLGLIDKVGLQHYLQTQM